MSESQRQKAYQTDGGKPRKTAEKGGERQKLPEPSMVCIQTRFDHATAMTSQPGMSAQVMHLGFRTLIIESYILQVLSCFVLRVCLLHPTFSPSMEATRMSYVLGNSGTQYSAPLPHPWLPEIIFLREPTH